MRLKHICFGQVAYSHRSSGVPQHLPKGVALLALMQAYLAGMKGRKPLKERIEKSGLGL